MSENGDKPRKGGRPVTGPLIEALHPGFSIESPAPVLTDIAHIAREQPVTGSSPMTRVEAIRHLIYDTLKVHTAQWGRGGTARFTFESMPKALMGGTPRILLRLPVSMIEQVDTFWHDRRLQTRVEAVRDLLWNGLRLAKQAKEKG